MGSGLVSYMVRVLIALLINSEAPVAPRRGHSSKTNRFPSVRASNYSQSRCVVRPQRAEFELPSTKRTPRDNYQISLGNGLGLLRLQPPLRRQPPCTGIWGAGRPTYLPCARRSIASSFHDRKWARDLHLRRLQ